MMRRRRRRRSSSREFVLQCTVRQQYEQSNSSRETKQKNKQEVCLLQQWSIEQQLGSYPYYYSMDCLVRNIVDMIIMEMESTRPSNTSQHSLTLISRYGGWPALFALEPFLIFKLLCYDVLLMISILTLNLFEPRITWSDSHGRHLSIGCHTCTSYTLHCDYRLCFVSPL